MYFLSVKGKGQAVEDMQVYVYAHKEGKQERREEPKRGREEEKRDLLTGP